MRVSEDRYSRDLRRIQLAHRLIRHEVRTYWIRAFTRFTAGRIRNLLRSYGLVADGVQRHRGSPPRLYTRFMAPAMHSEASALAGIAFTRHIVPEERVRDAWRTLPSLEFGENLCKAFELFRLTAPGATLNLDRFILLHYGARRSTTDGGALWPLPCADSNRPSRCETAAVRLV